MARFCSNCGSPASKVSSSLTLTVTEDGKGKRSPSPSVSSTSAGEPEERFIPGTIFADRYRIVGLLGRGGMGEVYRATDLQLAQSVALKFLTLSADQDGAGMERLRSEVRLSRQVSHPNVCRVYDIGEFQGHPFLSMEYVDGEDLASLLRRIGRLPQDKAIDIARHLCAGLAAAHAKGVLHRDLKPANILINGVGQVVISDFGLAAIAGDSTDAKSGTPAYMAPEQLTGEVATVQSDLYSLGLVLYELFTGRRALQATSLAELKTQHLIAPESPSLLVKDLHPAVESVILHCLAPNPHNRPRSALSVAAGLPGGDPLAMALAAGETPSPGVVAAAGEAIGISVRTASVLLCATLLFAAASFIVSANANFVKQAGFSRPPDVLRDQALQILHKFDLRPSTETADGFGFLGANLSRRATSNPNSAPIWPVYYWLRQSPFPLVNLKPDGAGITVGSVTVNDPPSSQAGMADIRLDTTGLLEFFSVTVPDIDPGPTSEKRIDWNAVLALTTARPSSFVQTEPKWLPKVAADERVAWARKTTGDATEEIRVEAAALRGRVVWLRTIYPWTKPDQTDVPPRSPTQRFKHILTGTIVCFLAAATFILARRNLHAGRGDKRGAGRLAGFVFVVHMIAVLFGAQHVFGSIEIDLMGIAAAIGLFKGALLWIGYLALEPLARKRWPHVLISWNRLLDGRWNDPLVARDAMLGILAACICNLITYLGEAVRKSTLGDVVPYTPVGPILDLRHYLAASINSIGGACLLMLLAFLLLFLVRMLVRSDAAAVLTLSMVTGFIAAIGSPTLLVDGSVYVLVSLVLFGVAARFGLTASLVLSVFLDLLRRAPTTIDSSLWYFSFAILTYCSMLAVAFLAFRIALAKRPLLPAD